MLFSAFYHEAESSHITRRSVSSSAEPRSLRQISERKQGQNTFSGVGQPPLSNIPYQYTDSGTYEDKMLKSTFIWWIDRAEGDVHLVAIDGTDDSRTEAVGQLTTRHIVFSFIGECVGGTLCPREASISSAAGQNEQHPENISVGLMLVWATASGTMFYADAVISRECTRAGSANVPPVYGELKEFQSETISNQITYSQMDTSKKLITTFAVIAAPTEATAELNLTAVAANENVLLFLQLSKDGALTTSPWWRGNLPAKVQQKFPEGGEQQGWLRSLFKSGSEPSTPVKERTPSESPAMPDHTVVAVACPQPFWVAVLWSNGELQLMDCSSCGFFGVKSSIVSLPIVNQTFTIPDYCSPVGLSTIFQTQEIIVRAADKRPGLQRRMCALVVDEAVANSFQVFHAPHASSVLLSASLSAPNYKGVSLLWSGARTPAMDCPGAVGEPVSWAVTTGGNNRSFFLDFELVAEQKHGTEKFRRRLILRGGDSIRCILSLGRTFVSVVNSTPSTSLLVARAQQNSHFGAIIENDDANILLTAQIPGHGLDNAANAFAVPVAPLLCGTIPATSTGVDVAVVESVLPPVLARGLQLIRYIRDGSSILGCLVRFALLQPTKLMTACTSMLPSFNIKATAATSNNPVLLLLTSLASVGGAPSAALVSEEEVKAAIAWCVSTENYRADHTALFGNISRRFLATTTQQSLAAKAIGLALVFVAWAATKVTRKLHSQQDSREAELRVDNWLSRAFACVGAAWQAAPMLFAVHPTPDNVLSTVLLNGKAASLLFDGDSSLVHEAVAVSLKHLIAVDKPSGMGSSTYISSGMPTHSPLGPASRAASLAWAKIWSHAAATIGKAPFALLGASVLRGHTTIVTLLSGGSVISGPNSQELMHSVDVVKDGFASFFQQCWAKRNDPATFVSSLLQPLLVHTLIPKPASRWLPAITPFLIAGLHTAKEKELRFHYLAGLFYAVCIARCLVRAPTPTPQATFSPPLAEPDIIVSLQPNAETLLRELKKILSHYPANEAPPASQAAPKRTPSGPSFLEHTLPAQNASNGLFAAGFSDEDVDDDEESHGLRFLVMLRDAVQELLAHIGIMRLHVSLKRNDFSAAIRDLSSIVSVGRAAGWQAQSQQRANHIAYVKSSVSQLVQQLFSSDEGSPDALRGVLISNERGSDDNLTTVSELIAAEMFLMVQRPRTSSTTRLAREGQRIQNALTLFTFLCSRGAFGDAARVAYVVAEAMRGTPHRTQKTFDYVLSMLHLAVDTVAQIPEVAAPMSGSDAEFSLRGGTYEASNFSFAAGFQSSGGGSITRQETTYVAPLEAVLQPMCPKDLCVLRRRLHIVAAEALLAQKVDASVHPSAWESFDDIQGDKKAAEKLIPQMIQARFFAEALKLCDATGADENESKVYASYAKDLLHKQSMVNSLIAKTAQNFIEKESAQRSMEKQWTSFVDLVGGRSNAVNNYHPLVVAVSVCFGSRNYKDTPENLIRALRRLSPGSLLGAYLDCGKQSRTLATDAIGLACDCLEAENSCTTFNMEGIYNEDRVRKNLYLPSLKKKLEALLRQEPHRRAAADGNMRVLLASCRMLVTPSMIDRVTSLVKETLQGPAATDQNLKFLCTKFQTLLQNHAKRDE